MVKLFFIINRISGTSDNSTVGEIIERFFRSRNGYEYEIHFTEYPNHARELAVKAIEWKADIVVAAGGDGTLNEVAGVLVGSEVILGMIPIGSGNGFARHFKIPFPVKEALETTISGRIIRVDVGVVNNQIFLSNTGFAIDADIIFNALSTKMRGFLSYFVAGVKSIFTFNPPCCTILLEDRKLEVRPYLFSIFNTSQYGYNVKITSGIEAEDGFLDLLIIDSRNLFKAIYLILRKPSDHPQYIRHRVKELTVEFRPALNYFQIDGELKNRGVDRVDVSIIPNGLKCLVPSDY